jgi:hypothetical protein
MIDTFFYFFFLLSQEATPCATPFREDMPSTGMILVIKFKVQFRMMNVLLFLFTGSRTNRKKTSAKMKMSKYLETLGKLLTED